MNFELLATDGAARRGTLTLAHGVAPTPTFMPVGTYGTVKGNGDAKHLDDIYYNTGLAMYTVMFEGIRNAVRQGGMPLTPAKIKSAAEKHLGKSKRVVVTITPNPRAPTFGRTIVGGGL